MRVRSFATLLFLAAMPLAAATKTHTVALGAARHEPYQPPDADKKLKGKEAILLKIRPLIIDGRQKEWTTGDTHDVTDRTYTVRRALRLNDALPGEAAHWIWQPGPWLTVDRVTGHIAALHLPSFDPAVSQAVWFRDYAAYCGVNSTAKSQTLVAVVAQIGARRAVVQHNIGKWDPQQHEQPVCAPAQWQRQPVRVRLQPTGAPAIDMEIVGATSSLIEDGDGPDEP
ncbi:MAG TPA: hypothetical protein VGB94_03520 [Acidobacteriaceae bacterium]